MFKHILLAFDGSENSYRAAEKVVYLAQLVSDSVVTIVYVVDSETSKTDVLHSPSNELISEKRKQLLGKVETLLEEKGISFNHEILHGEPAPTIVKYANSNNFDLVVLGSRGLNPFQEMVLGSVSHKIAKRANATVMIVK